METHPKRQAVMGAKIAGTASNLVPISSTIAIYLSKLSALSTVFELRSNGWIWYRRESRLLKQLQALRMINLSLSTGRSSWRSFSESAGNKS